MEAMTIQGQADGVDLVKSVMETAGTPEPSQSSDSTSPNPRRSRHSNISCVPSNNPTRESSKQRRSKHRKRSPNFRHFPADGNPRSFSTYPAGTLNESLSPLAGNIETFATDLTEEPVAVSPLTSESLEAFDDDDRRHPAPLPVVTNSALAMTSKSLLPTHTITAPDLPFNPSEYGLVHLPPLPSSPSPRSSKRGKGSTTSRSSGPSSQKSTRALYSIMGRDEQRKQDTTTPDASESNSSGSNSNSRPQSRSQSGSGSQSQSGSARSDESMTNVRFKHMQDENGNHVVVGREGKLLRCEDEPIATPGAIQGFGVLIAVDEQEDILSVRQVSENSTEILGLSPRYLFSLECFTDTLSDPQASLLWDNIQYLTAADGDDEEDSPHVFLLSGYGELGTASPNDIETKTSNGRRQWTCWCAVHRAASAANAPANSGLIIMEFELERDLLNPLYPPNVAENPQASGVASPGSGVGSSNHGSSTDESDRTLVSVGTGPNEVSSGSSGGDTPGSSKGAHSSDGRSSDDPLSPERGGPSPSAEQPSRPIEPPADISVEEDWVPSAEDIFESTTSRAKPIPALERLRRMTRPPIRQSASTGGARSRRARRAGGGVAASGVGMMDVFAVMAQINEQLGAPPDLETFLKVVVGVIKDLSQFHRVLIYQFDEVWNGQVVAELVDWSRSKDLFKGLHFPAGDIPAQARALYAINKVRLLYDRSHATARIVVKSKKDLERPLDMTHCYLRAMSPIHIQYLANMGVRASMSVSIMAFGSLWGLVTCHSYGSHGMRVSFPVRQMLRLLSQSISRNIERLSYAQRLHTRKLINTMVSEQHPTGYIVSNANDLLGLFDADFGILVIGEGAKILGPNQHGQEILILAEYLRLKQFTTIQASQAVVKDFLDLELTTGLEVIAGLLYVPLSSGGNDFIAFLRKGQPRHVRWAGRPYKDQKGPQPALEPRKSFKIWSETVAGRCRAWTDEQLETAGVLALVYGKFIEVWRRKESALQTTQLTNLLLSNASHEVRTPLNHIINYLEMAMNGPLDGETRENLSRSHAASKSLLFTINDLLDLTRLESGNETSFNEPFDLRHAIENATQVYRNEAERRNITFQLDLLGSPRTVIGDARKVRTVVQNLTANALKYTTKGSIYVCSTTYSEPEGLRGPKQTVVEIVVADTGCGIAPAKLENIFREFEQVESSGPKASGEASVGLGLAVVARIVEQLGGQLRVDSTVNEGSRFSFLIPLALTTDSSERSISPPFSSSVTSLRMRSRSASVSGGSEIDNLVEALSDHMSGRSLSSSPRTGGPEPIEAPPRQPAPTDSKPGTFPIRGSPIPVRPVKVDDFVVDTAPTSQPHRGCPTPQAQKPITAPEPADEGPSTSSLKVLIVEDNDINRTILTKRLRLDGHTVVGTTNGQEGFDMVVSDRSFDVVLMDIQMPILNGFEATRCIREHEKTTPLKEPGSMRRSQRLHGRIPIFAVSASLLEKQRDELSEHGMDGWILKPIDFKRLHVILGGVNDLLQKERDVYRPGCSWEAGGWLKKEQPSE
ncbi:hypothetical protein BD779DRAFT_1498791 [Infundibulicybe gibba]|nr:hypothetical protein BD779DRAFT_1498791 [Infundibulicybe gibba]